MSKEENNMLAITGMFDELILKIDCLPKTLAESAKTGNATDNTDSSAFNEAVAKIIAEAQALREVKEFTPRQIEQLKVLLDGLAKGPIIHLGKYMQDEGSKIAALLDRILTQLDAMQAALATPPDKTTVHHRHSLVLDFKNIKAAGVMTVMGFAAIFSLAGNMHQCSTSKQYRDNDLKYRFVRMYDGITAEEICRLERCWNDPDSSFVQKNIRRMVSEYEQRVRKQVAVPKRQFESTSTDVAGKKNK